jgi:hypothetical protein
MAEPTPTHYDPNLSLGALPGYANLSSDMQASIKAQVDAAVQAALAATKPAPPRELTEGERARLALLAAYSAERADHSTPSPVGAEIRAIVSLLDILVTHLYPDAEVPSPAVVSGAGGVSSEPTVVNVSSGR